MKLCAGHPHTEPRHVYNGKLDKLFIPSSKVGRVETVASSPQFCMRRGSTFSNESIADQIVEHAEVGLLRNEMTMT